MPSSGAPDDGLRSARDADAAEDEMFCGAERKSLSDFAAPLIDGRLFPQMARLAHSRYRSLFLIEGPTPASIPDVHPHSLEGALVSIAAMWRLPVLHSSDSEQSVRIGAKKAARIRELVAQAHRSTVCLSRR
jgi:ERCC4-type nuclease